MNDLHIALEEYLSSLLDIDEFTDTNFSTLPGVRTALIWPDSFTTDPSILSSTWFVGVTICELDLETLRESMYEIVDTVNNTFRQGECISGLGNATLSKIDISTPNSAANTADISATGALIVYIVFMLEINTPNG